VCRALARDRAPNTSKGEEKKKRDARSLALPLDLRVANLLSATADTEHAWDSLSISFDVYQKEMGQMLSLLEAPADLHQTTGQEGQPDESAEADGSGDGSGAAASPPAPSPAAPSPAAPSQPAEHVPTAEHIPTYKILAGMRRADEEEAEASALIDGGKADEHIVRESMSALSADTKKTVLEGCDWSQMSWTQRRERLQELGLALSVEAVAEARVAQKHKVKALERDRDYKLRQKLQADGLL